MSSEDITRTIFYGGRNYRVTAVSDRFVSPLFDFEYLYRVGNDFKKYDKLGGFVESYISENTLEEVFVAFLTETLSSQGSPLAEVLADSYITIEELD